ncbi:MAG: prefoldin subunit [archaeon]
MDEAAMQQKVVDFRKSREQLMMISGQKQQIQAQAFAISEALKELKETKEKKVYKAVGNILVLKDVDLVKTELDEVSEKFNLRVTTLQKQEDALLERLNKLRAEIEGEAQKAPAKEVKEAKETKKRK